MTGLMKRSGKRTVCGMVSSRNRKPPCGKKLVWQRLCTMRRLLCLYSNRPLRELSGLSQYSQRPDLKCFTTMFPFADEFLPPNLVNYATEVADGLQPSVRSCP